MTPRTIMIAAAAVLGGLGTVLLFAPLETAPWLGLAAGPDSEDTLQLLGSALFAFGFMDWTGRNAIYGGIYGRPIALGNVFVTTFLGVGLLRVQWERGPQTGGSIPGWSASILMVALAVAFWGLLFDRPWIRSPTA